MVPEIPSPEKVATPEPLVATGETPTMAAPPPVTAAAMFTLAWLTALPAPSRSWITGWVPKAAPLLALADGWVVMVSWVAAPAARAMLLETALVRAPEEKVSV